MNEHLKIASATVLLLTAAACASAHVSDVPASGVVSLPAVRTNDYGNIRWNKTSIHVYKSKGSTTATLTFWARDGYFTYPLSCQNGGKIEATPGTVKGNPNRYDRVKYTFVAKTAKADTCSFTAVLNNTGSPPLTTLTLYLNS
jgi:hypothetical protein